MLSWSLQWPNHENVLLGNALSLLTNELAANHKIQEMIIELFFHPHLVFLFNYDWVLKVSTFTHIVYFWTEKKEAEYKITKLPIFDYHFIEDQNWTGAIYVI